MLSKLHAINFTSHVVTGKLSYAAPLLQLGFQLFVTNCYLKVQSSAVRCCGRKEHMHPNLVILLKLFHSLISNLTVALCLDKKKPTVSRVTAIQGSGSGIILLRMVLHVAHTPSLLGRACLKKCMFLSGMVNISQESKVTVSGCLFSHMSFQESLAQVGKSQHKASTAFSQDTTIIWSL